MMKSNWGKSIPEQNSLEDIALTSQKLCEDYIHARLRRSGIASFDLSSTLSQTDCSLTLLVVGQILELRYPKLFSKVSLQLRITFGNEAVVWGAFNKFAINLFVNGITWAHIIALFAFAGGLAVDCAAHGRAIFLGRISLWLAGFVGKHLAAWIQRHGGWDGLVEHFTKTKDSQAATPREGLASPLNEFWKGAAVIVSYKISVAITSLIVAAAAVFYALL